MSACLSRHGQFSQPVLQFLCALEKFSDIGRSSVGLGSPVVFPGVSHAAATFSVDVLRTLV